MSYPLLKVLRSGSLCSYFVSITSRNAAKLFFFFCFLVAVLEKIVLEIQGDFEKVVGH